MNYVAIISKEDLKAAGFVPDGLTDSRLDPMIRKAQDLDLLPLLGSALMTDLMTNPTATANAKLIEGETYENANGDDVYFPGLKMALIYFTWSRLLPGNQNTLTSHGFNRKTNQYSEPVEGGELAREVNSAKSAAAGYWKQAEDYLNAKEADFDLWNCTTVRNAGAVRINSISKND